MTGLTGLKLGHLVRNGLKIEFAAMAKKEIRMNNSQNNEEMKRRNRKE